MTHWTESAGTWRRVDGVHVHPLNEDAWGACRRIPGRSRWEFLCVELFAQKPLVRHFPDPQSAMSAADKEWPISGGKEG